MKLSQEDRDKMIMSGIRKAKDYFAEGGIEPELGEDGYQQERMKICPECVKDKMDEEDLGWCVGYCAGNKIHCDIEKCESHRDIYGEVLD